MVKPCAHHRTIASLTPGFNRPTITRCERRLFPPRLLRAARRRARGRHHRTAGSIGQAAVRLRGLVDVGTWHRRRQRRRHQRLLRRRGDGDARAGDAHRPGIRQDEYRLPGRQPERTVSLRHQRGGELRQRIWRRRRPDVRDQPGGRHHRARRHATVDGRLARVHLDRQGGLPRRGRQPRQLRSVRQGRQEEWRPGDREGLG